MTVTLIRALLVESAGRTFAFGGHDVFYRDEARSPGEPRALLLIHGFPTSSFDWWKLWPALVLDAAVARNGWRVFP